MVKSSSSTGNGYYDLSLKVSYYDSSSSNSSNSSNKEQQALLKRMIELGWDCVAWNTKAMGISKAKKTKPQQPVRLDYHVLKEALQYRLLTTSSSSISNDNNMNIDMNLIIKQMTRITITIDDIIEAQNLTSGNETFKDFDIVAVCPGNIDVFTYLCKHAEVDIICLDYNKKTFSPDKKTLDEALKRNVCFEVCYNGLLGTSSTRRDLLNNTKTMLQYLRNRNVIFSSDAENWLQVRSPLDVVNLAQCVQLNKQQAMKTVADNSTIVVNHAKARKLKFLPIEIMSVTDMNRMFKLTTEMLQLDASDIMLADDNKKNNKNENSDSDDNDDNENEKNDRLIIDLDDDDTGFISLPQIDIGDDENDDSNDDDRDDDISATKRKLVANAINQKKKVRKFL